MKNIIKTLIWVTAFAIAMGFLETSVVVYLRALYYPHGFGFPMKTIDHGNGVTEFWRELATLVMLFAAGYIAGKDRASRFAYFIYSFAIWDLFYYVFLKVLLDWPESLMTWDLLFLIPMPWVGPVLAPCIVDFTMIVLAFIILKYSEQGLKARLIRPERWLIILGCAVIIVTFVKDYVSNLYANHDFDIWTPMGKSELFADFMTFVPDSYSWWLFAIGEICLLSSIYMYQIRMKKQAERAMQPSLISVRP